MNPADQAKVQRTSFKNVKTLITNAALGRTNIPVVQPIPDQPVEVVVPTIGNNFGFKYGIVKPRSVNPSSENLNQKPPSREGRLLSQS